MKKALLISFILMVLIGCVSVRDQHFSKETPTPMFLNSYNPLPIYNTPIGSSQINDSYRFQAFENLTRGQENYSQRGYCNE